MKFDLIATTTFGLEAVAKREIEKLGYKIVKAENGKITFSGNERGIVRANLWLRTADRVLLKVDEFMVTESEELFQRVGGIAWEEIIPVDGKFTVTCSTVKSQLRSEPNNQKTVKKAIALRLADFYGTEKLEEIGAEYTVKISMLKDRATLTVDTTGEGLHKRGYRVAPVTAPVKETLASAMVQLTFWREGRLLVDPCCGSGTIPIEAAMLGRNIAPGLSRSFASEGWELIPEEIWKEERKAAYSEIDYETDIRIKASDIDAAAITAAKGNAEEAGVDDCIDFSCMDVKNMKAGEESGIIITNPPYGERIGSEKGIKALYDSLAGFFRENPTWSLFMITPDKEAEEAVMGRKADRRRKLYNGRMEVCYYQFHGEKR
ncbi:MAG: class I SAM-dependent RNA methyltransferase [Eubacteriaceae bacterium]|nr:class I SAM-dependent RNA methyltransferase [Eubacteriaceae bacterium]